MLMPYRGSTSLEKNLPLGPHSRYVYGIILRYFEPQVPSSLLLLRALASGCARGLGVLVRMYGLWLVVEGLTDFG